MYALVDSNNFYVSCERVWNPKLRSIPVMVLSNNDGCVISRSNEVKAMGIKMGEPYFKIKETLEQNGVAVFSSNFALYGDLSSRVVQTLKQFSSDLEIYSIDESFLRLDLDSHSRVMVRHAHHDTQSLEAYGRQIRATILKNVGIPSCVGIAPTKTLAKLANQLAKKHPDFKEVGVCDLSSMSEEKVDEYLKDFFVGDIWGVGRKSAPKLVEIGIETAYKLKKADKRQIRNRMKVVGERIVRELNGVSCLPLDLVRAPKKSIACTRSFGRYIESLEELEQAVSHYANRASEKLREQNSTTSMISVFIRTNYHKKNHNQYYNSRSVPTSEPVFDTFDITKAALNGLRQIYRKGYKYAKAGVILYGIENAEFRKYDMFDDEKEVRDIKKKRLMKAFDQVNKKFGGKSLFPASEGVRQGWHSKKELISKKYTTDWNELPDVI